MFLFRRRQFFRFRSEFDSSRVDLADFPSADDLAPHPIPTSYGSRSLNRFNHSVFEKVQQKSKVYLFFSSVCSWLVLTLVTIVLCCFFI